MITNEEKTISIVLTNGWSVVVKKDQDKVWNEILHGSNEFLDVEDILGHRYCIRINCIVCVKERFDQDLDYYTDRGQF